MLRLKSVKQICLNSGINHFMIDNFDITRLYFNVLYNVVK